MKSNGMVYYVGVGPGEVGFLTLRGAELLRRAEVVLHDGGVSPELLRLAPPTAEVLSAQAPGSEPARPALHELARARAAEGRCVVWLHSHDFGLSPWEAEHFLALKSDHISFEMVPGVSSLAALPACAGIPLAASTCPVFTVADLRPPRLEQPPTDWRALAFSPGGKVLLLNAGQVSSVATAVLAAGLPAESLAAVVLGAGTPQQRITEATLGTIAVRVTEDRLAGPVTLVLGEGVRLRHKLNGFEKRPLFGLRVVVTRSRDQAGEMSRLLAERGAEPLEIPVIKISPPTDREPLIEALLGLNAYNWLIFTSPNGVNQFFDYFFKSFQDLRDIGGVRLAAVGPATAARLRHFHLQVDVMPEEYVATKIVKAMADFESLDNLRICLLRAEVANRDLPRLLEDKGGIVDDIALYKTEIETTDPQGTAADLLARGADWLTFTSGSTVENFHARFNLPGLLQKFPRARTASIGPETSKALAALGLTPALEAREHTVEGLVKALEHARPVRG